MTRLNIAFDVDGTLIDYKNSPRYDVIQMLHWFQKHDHKIYIWSEEGIEYAEKMANKLGLIASIIPKNKSGQQIDRIDICFDDEIVDLAKVNIQV